MPHLFVLVILEYRIRRCMPHYHTPLGRFFHGWYIPWLEQCRCQKGRRGKHTRRTLSEDGTVQYRHPSLPSNRAWKSRPRGVRYTAAHHRIRVHSYFVFSSCASTSLASRELVPGSALPVSPRHQASATQSRHTDSCIRDCVRSGRGSSCVVLPPLSLATSVSSPTRSPLPRTCSGFRSLQVGSPCAPSQITKCSSLFR